MFNNIALDVFIGLVFVFLLYSLLATIVQELLATRMAFRAKILEKVIVRMLEDGKSTAPTPFLDRIFSLGHLLGFKNFLKNKNVAAWFYAHPQIKYLGEDNVYSKPAYINAENFSKVIIDLLKGFGHAESEALKNINASIQNGTIYKMPINFDSDKNNPAIKALIRNGQHTAENTQIEYDTVKITKDTALYLRSLWQEAGADTNKFKLLLEKWFNDTNERATGWYKKYTQLSLLLIGFVMAVVFNVDSIAIHRILSKDEKAREQLVQVAIANATKYDSAVRKNDRTPEESEKAYHVVMEDVNKANNILGLGRPWKDTCTLCKDSLPDIVKRGDTARLKLDSLKIMKPQQGALLAAHDTLIKKRPKDSVSAAVLKKQIAKLDTVIARLDERSSLANYNRSVLLQQRCEFISKARKGKWYQLAWLRYSPYQNGGWETLFGWVITALAISLGAPFWFDLLNKMIKLRGTGTKLTADNNNSNSTGGAPPSQTSTPVTVNVNPNPGEEAVG